MHIKAENGLFVCAEQGGGLNGFERRDVLIANRVEAREWETFTEEEHGDGTVSLQCANGMYVCAENGGGGPVSTNRSAAGPWERFRRFMSTDGRVQYLCFDGVHFLRVRTDLAQPVVDATGVAQGFTFRRLNTLASLIERARIRGSMFTARFPMSLGPRPGQPSNILAMVAMPFLPQSEQDAAFGAYLDRGYTHAVSGPIVDPGGNHGIYPPSDFTQADAFNRYLDVLERGSTRGLQWIHFVKPDNWTLDEVQRELEPLYRQPRAQELLGLVIPAGWEPGRFGAPSSDGDATCSPTQRSASTWIRIRTRPRAETTTSAASTTRRRGPTSLATCISGSCRTPDTRKARRRSRHPSSSGTSPINSTCGCAAL